MKYALMLNVVEGGVFEPIIFGIKSLKSDRSIILMDEYTPALWLWYGMEQNFISRRIAQRKAEWLRSNGYKYGDIMIGRDIKLINKIEQDKIDFSGLFKKE